jgi:endogenous inhibitor of DNA gyrase (YacG/DUF329 family)
MNEKKVKWCDNCGKRVETECSDARFFCSPECEKKWHDLWGEILAQGEVK